MLLIAYIPFLHHPRFTLARLRFQEKHQGKAVPNSSRAASSKAESSSQGQWGSEMSPMYGTLGHAWLLPFKSQRFEYTSVGSTFVILHNMSKHNILSLPVKICFVWD